MFLWNFAYKALVNCMGSGINIVTKYESMLLRQPHLSFVNESDCLYKVYVDALFCVVNGMLTHYMHQNEAWHSTTLKNPIKTRNL